MIKADCHTHTAFSSDSDTPVRDQLEAAVRLGLDTICITDHYDYLFPHDVPGGFVFDVSEYYLHLQKLREEYAGRIRVNIGVEFGLRNEPEFREQTRQHLEALEKEYDFDFIIGSTHLLENYDPAYEEFWDGRTKDEVMRMYFESIVHNVNYYDCFDSYGHLDYIIRYTPDGKKQYEYSDYSDMIDEILKGLVSKGKALECNSAGLKYGLGFAHPKPEILKRYRELGGELITIGSDGHRPEHLAYDFDAVKDCLNSIGFSYYTVFEGRKPVMRKL